MPETIDGSASPYVAPNSAEPTSNGRDVSGSMTISHIVYGLHALAPFTFWTLAVVAMIIGVVKKNDVSNSWLASHYQYLSRTFWWGILWAALAWGAYWILGLLTLGLGWIVLWVLPLIVLVWYLYRVIKGWIKLSESKPVQ